MTRNPMRKLSAEALYAQLRRLIETMPDLKTMGVNSKDTNQWLGRACAVVAEAEGIVGELEFKQARDLYDRERHPAADRIEGIMKERPLSVYYDEVALLGLQLAQSDVTRGTLDPSQAKKIRDAVVEVVDDLIDKDDQSPTSDHIARSAHGASEAALKPREWEAPASRPNQRAHVQLPAA
jgi:hypothetical protein